MAHSTNRILDALPETEKRSLARVLKTRTLKQRMVLHDAAATIEQVYFPFDAVISLVVPMTSGDSVEAAMVGHDGVVGASAVLNSPVALNKAVVQLEGEGQVCDVATVRRMLHETPVLLSLLVRHEQALFAQAQQSAACNAAHDLEARLCRWLLRSRDLRGSNHLELTQEYMAEMLGVRRTSLSIIAHTLQGAGLIKYRRGNIELLNVEGLKESACECYEAVKANYDALERPQTNV